MEIEVKIRALMMDPNSGTPIIILKDIESDTMLPIWVGAYEANAIALEIEKIAPPRPMTHDLLRNLQSTIRVLRPDEGRSIAFDPVDHVFELGWRMRDREGDGDAARQPDAARNDDMREARRHEKGDSRFVEALA